MVEPQVMAVSAKQGDVCLREVPRLLTKEEIRSLSEIDSGKAMLAFLPEDRLAAILDEVEKPKHVRKRFTAAY